jgi:phospholipid/cholesterol/gamma-HCH transport system ATP-binding protein
MDNMIELQGVSKSFGGRSVLDDVSLEIRRGETFVIIGMSGTGKTVTLRHIAGLLDPNLGVLLVDNQKISHSKNYEKKLIRKKMGMVFQSGALINWLSVRDNISLPLIESRRFSSSEIDAAVNEKLNVLNLMEAADRMPGEISGGMKKRVCLARVLVRNPEIILYDEPTSGLDPVMSSVINDLIIKMKQEYGVTSVVVTHDMESAFRIADRIAMIYEGRIIECDIPEKVMRSKNKIVGQFVKGSLDGPIDVQR